MIWLCGSGLLTLAASVQLRARAPAPPNSSETFPARAAFAVGSVIVGWTVGRMIWRLNAPEGLQSLPWVTGSLCLLLLTWRLSGLRLQSLLPALLAILATAPGLRVVTTPSVPVGVYRTVPLNHQLPERNTYVCFETSSTFAPPLFQHLVKASVLPKEWSDTTFIKVAAGLPGDRVTRDHDTALRINGVRLAHSKWGTTAKHALIPRLPLPDRLGSTEVWLASEHARGFDSRYFGAVDILALSCRAELLWAW